jgi:hypothetical protein
MSVNVAGKRLSKGDLAVAGGLVVALVGAFLPWHTTSVFNSYVCGDSAACGPGTIFQASHNAFGYWSGAVFFVAVLVGLALFVPRHFVSQVTLPRFTFSDATIYAGVGVVMALCGIVWLVTGGGYAVLSPLGPFTSAPGVGILVGFVAAAAVLIGAFVLRSEPQPAPQRESGRALAG